MHPSEGHGWTPALARSTDGQRIAPSGSSGYRRLVRIDDFDSLGVIRTPTFDAFANVFDAWPYLERARFNGQEYLVIGMFTGRAAERVVRRGCRVEGASPTDFAEVRLRDGRDGVRKIICVLPWEPGLRIVCRTDVAGIVRDERFIMSTTEGFVEFPSQAALDLAAGKLEGAGADQGTTQATP